MEVVVELFPFLVVVGVLDIIVVVVVVVVSVVVAKPQQQLQYNPTKLSAASLRPKAAPAGGGLRRKGAD